jgi:hypothetical protein
MAADVFVIGYGDDTHALTEVLRVEAPTMLARLTIVEPDAGAVRRLADRLDRSAPPGLAATALLAAAVIAPSRLRDAARFLEALATGPGG